MEKYLIEPRCGMRIDVKNGQLVTIKDIEGGQVAYFFAEVKGTHDEYLSPAVTLDCNESLNIGVGTILYSNLYRPLFEVIYDDVGRHDLLFPSCSKAMYDFFYQNGEGHPNCLDNINRALGTSRTIIQPVNFFMNTRIDPNGKIVIERPASKAGDKIILRALEDCALGISACSVSEAETNSGTCTPIGIYVDEMMDSEVDRSLKLCGIDDLDELCALAIRTYYETFAAFNTPEDMEEYLNRAFDRERLRKELEDKNSMFFFLCTGEKLAGYLKVNETPSQTDINDPESLEIERIYVSTEFQGKGLGRYLMEQALTMAVARKKKYAWLGVWERNEKAICFYEKNGFYKIGAHAFIMGEDIQTDYIMRKDLEG